MVILESLVPGGIIIFLGFSAIIVGGGLYMGYINDMVTAFLTWFILSIVSMLFLRSLFIKYFEGDTSLDNVDEDEDLKGGIVEVVEEILPHKEGRVRFRDSTWVALSDEEISVGKKAVISKRRGNKLEVKSI